MNNAQLPIIDAATLRLALQDLISTDVETDREDLRDMRRILVNLHPDVVHAELFAVISAKLSEVQS